MLHQLNNKDTPMTKRHVTLYNNLDNPAPAEVLRQELVTTERTQEGVRITRYKLRFTHSDMVDSFESEPLNFLTDNFQTE